jgi:hypothetical protein
MLSALFGFLLLASEPTVPSTTGQAASAGETAGEPKKICKREQVTGQLQGTKRVCLTAEQWKARQEVIARAKR